MKYEIGDRVQIKGLDWYNENKDRINEVACGNTFFIPEMAKYCEKIVTISFVLPVVGVYHIKEDGGMFNWTDDMIEGLMEEETKPKYEDEVTGEYYSTPKYLVRPSGYQFVDENGSIINARKIVLEKKKIKYPKTYEECCELLDGCSYNIMFDRCETSYEEFLHNKLLALRKLIICRDAYWKIAGEEMGLGKPWEPDWKNEEGWIHCITNDCGGICCTGFRGGNKILAFPTEEMRDAFYENFKDIIEICKELL